MLYGQLIQVLLLHPYRNRTFWAIIVYSFAMVPFAFASFVGQTSSQMITVIHGRDFLLSQPTSPWCNTLSQIRCVSLVEIAYIYSNFSLPAKCSSLPWQICCWWVFLSHGVENTC